MNIKIVLLFLLPLVIGDLNPCPSDSPGWFQAGDKCYHVSRDKMNWFEAQQV